MNTKTVTVGNLTFTMRSRITIGFYAVAEELETFFKKPMQEFNQIEDAFLTCDYSTLELQVNTENQGALTEDELSLVEYFEKRNGSVVHNWELSQDTLTLEALPLWLKAYGVIRSAPISAEKKENSTITPVKSD